MKYFLALLFNATLCVAVFAEPIVIAHRGASGYLPEHTLEAAVLAHALGSDYIEQDLVLSKDGVPIVLHDIHLDTVTDVAERFPERSRSDGRYYVIDFTLAELKQLTVSERRKLTGEQVFPKRYQGNAHFTIATFEEHIEVIRNLNRQQNKTVGLYPEIKAPAWHRQQGYDISRIVLDVLAKHGLNQNKSKVFLQCFDFDEVKRLKTELKTPLPLIQLIGYRSETTDYAYLQTEAGISELSQYAVGVGPAIAQLIDLKHPELSPTEFANRLKQQGLLVHPYTHRLDQLPQTTTSSNLLKQVFSAGATGIFSDFPDSVRHYLSNR